MLSDIFSKKTRWICASERFASPQNANENGENRGQDALLMLARRSVKLPKRISSARVKISADDFYGLYINGSLVSVGTAGCYPEEQYVQLIDVTGHLKAGLNIIAAFVYYDGRGSRCRVSGDDRQGLIMELEIDDEIVLCSNDRFRVLCPAGASFIRGETLCSERLDLRSFPADWAQPKFDDSGWAKPHVNKNPDYNFVMQPTFPDELKEISFKSAGDDTYDLGGEHTGILNVEAQGADGSRLSFLNEDSGELLYELTLNGGAEVKFSLPQRLNRIKVASEGGAAVKRLSATALSLPMGANAMEIRASSPLIAKAEQRWRRALISDAEAAFDWSESKEDEGVKALARAYLTGDNAFMAMRLKNMALSQSRMMTLLGGSPASEQSANRDLSLMFTHHAYIYYIHSGDKELLERLRQAATGVIRAFSTYAGRDGLLESAGENGEKHCFSRLNALYIGALISYEKICAALNEDSSVHSAPAVRAFNEAFFDAEKGLYTDAKNSKAVSQEGNIFPIYFDFADDRLNKDAALEILSETGEAASEYYRLKALCACGGCDKAYKQISEGACPSEAAALCCFTEEILNINEAVAEGGVWKNRLPDEAGDLSARLNALKRKILFTKQESFITLKL